MSTIGPRRISSIDSGSAYRGSQAEERLQLAMDAAGMGAWDWDLESGHVTWSGDQERLLGLGPGSFDGKYGTFSSLVHPDDLAGLQQRMDDAVAHQRARHRDEFRIVRPDGSVRWMLANGRIFYDESGKAMRMIGINMDVTERRYAEASLRQTGKLAATGRLAATIAHELNNPLAAVTNLLYILDTHPSLDEAARSYVRMAQHELSRMSHIVRQTLGFHRQAEAPVAVNMTELLDSVLDLHEAGRRAGGTRIFRRFEGDAVVEGYPAELRQVFANLLINAVEASPERGIVVVHVYPSRRWSGAEEQGTRVVIADNGAGIPAAHRRHIFEPFFTTKGDKGSGLGLWVTAGIVEKHGGTLRMSSSSRPGRSGTTFSVFLPRARTAAEEPKRIRAQRHPAQLPLKLNAG